MDQLNPVATKIANRDNQAMNTTSHCDASSSPTTPVISHRGSRLIAFALFACVGASAHAADASSEAPVPAWVERSQTLVAPAQTAASTTTTVQACLVNANAPTSLELCDAAREVASNTEERALIMSILAIAQSRRGQLVEASQSLEQAIALIEGPNTRPEFLTPESQLMHASIYANAGTFNLYNGDYTGAIDAYTRAQSHSRSAGGGEQSELYLNRSLALRAIGRYDEAKTDYEYYVALTTNPQILTDGPNNTDFGRAQSPRGANKINSPETSTGGADNRSTNAVPIIELR